MTANARLRFLLVLLSGMLIAVGSLALIVIEPAAGALESPIMVAAPSGTGPAAASPVTEPSEIDLGLENQPGSAVGVPRSSYAPEPVQEIGLIEIPKLGLNHRVWHGVTLNNIDHGPSHWPGTALPGEAGNTVFAGHRTTHSAPFRRINELVAGDEIFFTVAGIRTRYEVTGNEVVTPDRLDIVGPTAEPTATLFACHPPGSARYRFVVRARYTGRA
ncbi:MAG: sortase [Acidimicrobiales bacterium]